MKFSMTSVFAAAAIAAAVLLTACEPRATDSSGDNPLVGKTCTIQFRRDVLGVAGGTAFSPLDTKINDVDTVMEGLLRSTHGEWVVIENKGREVWIPKSVILYIRF